MDRAFIAFGDGYERGSRTGTDGRCTAFDGFAVIAAPLGDFDKVSRESRVWRRPGANYGVTYDSHAIKLAEKAEPRVGGGLYILVQHGGGREVLEFYNGPDWRACREAFLAMDERTLYALLYSVWETAARARREARDATESKWSRAALDKRIKFKRKGGRRRVYVAPERRTDESDESYSIRLVCAAP